MAISVLVDRAKQHLAFLLCVCYAIVILGTSIAFVFVEDQRKYILLQLTNQTFENFFSRKAVLVFNLVISFSFIWTGIMSLCGYYKKKVLLMLPLNVLAIFVLALDLMTDSSQFKIEVKTFLALGILTHTFLMIITNSMNANKYPESGQMLCRFSKEERRGLSFQPTDVMGYHCKFDDTFGNTTSRQVPKDYLAPFAFKYGFLKRNEGNGQRSRSSSMESVDSEYFAPRFPVDDTYVNNRTPYNLPSHLADTADSDLLVLSQQR